MEQIENTKPAAAVTAKKKKSVPQVYKLINRERARKLLKEVLTSDGAKQRMALAGLIASITDPKGNAEKFATAEMLLQNLFVETEQFRNHLFHYLNKIANEQPGE